jgi:hypothetical protein
MIQMICMKCGGSLDDVQAAQCPACGQAFNPDRPASVTRQRKKTSLSHWTGLVAFIGSLFILSLPYVGFSADTGVGGLLVQVRKGPVKVLSSITDSSMLVVKSGDKRSLRPNAVTVSWLVLCIIFGALTARAWMTGKGAAERGASSDMV